MDQQPSWRVDRMALKRVNPITFKRLLDSMNEQEHHRQRQEDLQRAEAEHSQFVQGYAKGICYLCGKPFKTLSKNEPCVHWLLRQCKFKKNYLPLIYERFGYTQMAAFTRWAANQERLHGNINDLLEAKGERKLFEFTVKWKNIEWTFDCSRTDYEGHKDTHSNFPHYHLQMRIDNRPFINFGDFHLPLSEEDLFYIDMSLAIPESFRQTFGFAGAGMQAASEVDAEIILENAVTVTDENEGIYRMQTMMMAADGETIDGQMIQDMIRESQKTGRTMASMAHKYMPDSTGVITVISPAESVPDIARRTERKRR
jgi:hypothetical protein